MTKKSEDTAATHTVDLVSVEQAEKHGAHQYEAGVITGAIVAANITSNRAATLRNFIFDMGVGALVGVGAIMVGRAFDYLLKTKKDPVKGEIIHATVLENTPPSEHSR